MSNKTWTGKGDWPRRCLTSREEQDYRDWYYNLKRKPSLKTFNAKIAEIRKRTKRP